MKAKILTFLRERKGYVSGQELCEQFGVSRTAVWKAIEQLRKEGYDIQAVPSKGYCLLSIPDTFAPRELESRLLAAGLGEKLNFYKETDSTNIRAAKLGEEGAPSGTLVVADAQNAGKGRRGRGWESPAGTNSYFTLLLRPQCAPNLASMLTLVMALGVAEAIEREAGLPAKIKWPNDIVVNGKKVVGILTEMKAEPDYIHHVVIGVGINVGKQHFTPEVAAKATTLEEELEKQGKKVEDLASLRANLIVKSMETFGPFYQAFLQRGDLTSLQQIYNEKLVNAGAQVQVLDPQAPFCGKALGINEKGELLVEREDGRVIPVYAGEVSVRGIYGYV